MPGCAILFRSLIKHTRDAFIDLKSQSKASSFVLFALWLPRLDYDHHPFLLLPSQTFLPWARAWSSSSIYSSLLNFLLWVNTAISLEIAARALCETTMALMRKSCGSSCVIYPVVHEMQTKKNRGAQRNRRFGWNKALLFIWISSTIFSIESRMWDGDANVTIFMPHWFDSKYLLHWCVYLVLIQIAYLRKYENLDLHTMMRSEETHCIHILFIQLVFA